MTQRTAALLRSLGAIACWSVAPILVRATREHFSVLFQTFTRYLASMAVLWPVLAVTRGRVALRKDFAAIIPALPKILVVALVNYVFQVAYTVSFYTLLPGFASLVNQSGVVFSVGLALVFFADERRTLGKPLFAVGLAVALVGVVLTIVGDGGSLTRGNTLWPGLPAMLLSAFSWALLGTLVKRWLGAVHPLFAVALVFTVVTPLFLISDLAVSGGLVLPRAPADVWVVVALSGLVGVGLGHSLYYSAVPVVGVTTASSLGLLLPFLAGVLSFLVFGERLGALQLVGGALLLMGCWVVIRTRYQA